MSVETVPNDNTPILHATFDLAGVAIASAVGKLSADIPQFSNADSETLSGDSNAGLGAGTSRSISHFIPGHALTAQLVTSTAVFSWERL